MFFNFWIASFLAMTPAVSSRRTSRHCRHEAIHVFIFYLFFITYNFRLQQ
jgi:hypothetical protein